MADSRNRCHLLETGGGDLGDRAPAGQSATANAPRLDATTGAHEDVWDDLIGPARAAADAVVVRIRSAAAPGVGAGTPSAITLAN